MAKARLAEIRLPGFGVSAEQPQIAAETYRDRLSLLRRRVAAAGLDALVIYADREHCANLAWLTGFDPRFEEALLVLAPRRAPVLLTGPENQAMASAAPLATDVRLYRPFGLMGQERAGTPPLADLLAGAGIARGLTVGVAGWKYFGPLESRDPRSWLEIPSFIADTLRKLAGRSGRVVNAGAILMDPGRGLRATTCIDELARFEFAACHVSEGVKRVVLGARPGMTEFEAARFLQPIGLPLSCHAMFSSGERAWQGLPGPSSKKMARGEAVTTAYGVQGALSCRNGWLAEGPDDLPPDVRDYVERLVAPYFEAVAAWLSALAIGVSGGDLYEAVMARLGDPFFGVSLNPGHLIHVDEWMHSPIAKGSRVKMRSGMALQVDVIPATGGPWFTTNMEDGVALLDERGRAALAEKYPAAWSRISDRRAFMAEALGIVLKPEVLPFSNLASYLPPFWLSPGLAMTLR
jgi:Xaa-Pro aminopeptidase